jgi:hypothetical protein
LRPHVAVALLTGPPTSILQNNPHNVRWRWHTIIVSIQHLNHYCIPRYNSGCYVAWVHPRILKTPAPNYFLLQGRQVHNSIPSSGTIGVPRLAEVTTSHPAACPSACPPQIYFFFRVDAVFPERPQLPLLSFVLHRCTSHGHPSFPLYSIHRIVVFVPGHTHTYPAHSSCMSHCVVVVAYLRTS